MTLLLISTGLAELILIGLSIATGFPTPLLAVQILWLNLVTNGIQDVFQAFLIHILATEGAFLQSLLHTQPLPAQYWLIFTVIGSIILVVVELYKWIKQRRFEANLEM